MKTDLAKVEKETPQDTNSRFDLKYFPHSDLLADALSEMFPEQTYEDKTFKKAKEIMGKDYTAEEIKSLIASFEYLIAHWMDEYERKVFNNKSLKELLDSI